MQFSQIISFVSFATAVVAAPAAAAPNCNKPTTPTLPSTGATDLPAPAAGLTLKALAIGHGLQNYTCANTTSTAAAVGALAVLYDITALYSNPAFANISSSTLWTQALPLNLVDQAAAAEPTAANLPETAYQADAANPFPATPATLSLVVAGQQTYTAPFLGRHFFDAAGAPTFDLSAAAPAALYFAGAKTGDVKAPAGADAGLLATGAVDWLQLGDNGLGKSVGVSSVYRVVTAGGVAQACSVSGATPAGQVFSVPYAAQYWFYG